MMVEKEIGEIRRMGRSKKQKEDGMKSRKVEVGIGNVRRTRRIWMTES
jgi:DNA helicase TIP49 (TBP-interacting protein)